MLHLSVNCRGIAYGSNKITDKRKITNFHFALTIECGSVRGFGGSVQVGVGPGPRVLVLQFLGCLQNYNKMRTILMLIK